MVPAKDIAEDLYEVCVLLDEESCRPEKYGVPIDCQDRFREKMHFYREAMVLRALVDKSRTDPDYTPMLHAYEEIVMPGSQTPEGTAKMLAFREAMKDLDEMVFVLHDKPVTWGMKWMATIGVVAPNPLHMVLLSATFTIKCISIGRSLKALRSHI